MDDSIRTALTDQLTRCEARCARLTAELESVTAAMQQSDAANVALARKLTDLVREVREWNRMHEGTAVRWPGLENIVAKYEAKR